MTHQERSSRTSSDEGVINSTVNDSCSRVAVTDNNIVTPGPDVVVVQRDEKRVLDFDKLNLDNDVTYDDALFNGFDNDNCENKMDNERCLLLSRSKLENLGADRNWMGKSQRLRVAPIHCSENKHGGRRVEFSCIHDELWESLPEYVSISADKGVLNLCKLRFGGPTPVCAVEMAPGAWLPVLPSCLSGTCRCVFVLEGETTQLRPCQFAASVWGMGVSVSLDDMMVLTGVCRGFRIVDHGCNASYFSKNYPSLLQGHFKGEMNDIIRNELAEGKLRGVKVKPRCVHSLGGVEKSDGSLRPVTDCSRPKDLSINNFMEETCKKFKYKSLDDVVELLEENAYCAISDIQGAYRTVAIIPSHREFQGICWDSGRGDQYLQDLRVCFGLSSAPFLFTQISDFVVKIGRDHGYGKCVNYLDDFLVTDITEAECGMAQQALCGNLERLGFIVKQQKQVLPATMVKFLGIMVNTADMTLSVGADKLGRVRDGTELIQGKDKCKRKSLEQLAGLLAHCATVVRGGRTYTRRIYNFLRDTEGQDVVTLTELIKLDLSWWKTFMGWFNGKARILNHKGKVWSIGTDASDHGFGGFSDFGHFWGCWEGSQGRCPHEASPPTEDYDDHINEEELWPVLVGCQRWGEAWRDSVVYVSTDNTQVQAVLNTGRSHNATAMAWARELFWVCTFYNIYLKGVWVAGVDNILADSLSRLYNKDCVTICCDKLPEFVDCCSRVAGLGTGVGGRKRALLGTSVSNSVQV